MTKDDKSLTEKAKLNFEKAKEMTIGEAVRKESELRAGVTEDDGVLDKYIKQNRDQVESQKFSNIDIDKLDTAVLDNFIKQQREELSQTGLLQEEPLASVKTEEQVVAEKVEQASQKTTSIFDEVDVAPVAPARTSNLSRVNDSAEDDFVLGDEADQVPVYKRKKWLLGGLAALTLGVFGLGYALNQSGNAAKTSVTGSNATSQSSTTSSSSNKSAEKAAAKADLDAFNQTYDSFFADSEKTKLKNSEFANLPNLESALKKLEGTEEYSQAKAKYDKLSKAMAAIQAVNAKFETEAIVDGEKMAATLKADANLDDLTSDVLNTGNASVDTLLQSVISEARTNAVTTGLTPEEKAAQEAAASEAAANTATDAAVNTEGATADQTTPAQSSEAVAQTPSSEVAAVTPAPAPVQEQAATPAAPAVSSIGSDSSVLQRNLTRVPYNDSAIADTANPAWAFNPGVLENIIAISRARGYFTDNNYYVEPVNIINGNGYYNMFKSDGTYLFSINAKTGYFVGNAPGNADNLDY
ncbi:cell division site-positioning protein MapZ family protein [Streptococcus cuniculipharyngis]|uniref:Mid-cell-anchored protein Z n=1 Tax=Streptococcus cuniculipharyngis TaxID=1562651 RepID=A0A5C5SB50_9STRE|nr:cell division site-positioning protein MapZ family protein [Streptococcus cuniculipharyngis]TWS98107.1 hypothetical protein FRX57_04045 [Streptococcus cuniculipharyngis]